MKKRLLVILLAAVMVLPLLASCNKGTEIEEKPVSIYTLYTIADTTPEALRQVELALNRILFYRIGVCVDIVAVSEDKYQELIDNQLKVMADYDAAKKNKKSSSSSATESVTVSGVQYDGVLTGEKYLEFLEKGEDVAMKQPRLDMFLVRSYESYFDLATKGLLASLDEKLTAEAKVIRDYIHESFFTAAKINKKTYGVPTNDAIGSYKYIVFDKELLEKYNFDAKTMFTLKDLEEYLDEVKKNEPDVIPLQSSAEPTQFSFMFNTGFPAYINEKTNEVVEAYKDKNLLDFYGMIARYNTLGYFSNSTGDKDARFAVAFVEGTENDIKALEEKTGKELAFNVYQNPIATNEGLFDSAYVVSKYCVANDLTAVMKMMAQFYTQADVQNIFSYGVQGKNYTLNDNKQVVRINKDYMMNRDYTGNKLISYTLADEDPDMWIKMKKQNLDSVAAKSLGFSYTQQVFTYTDKENKQAKVYEPNYKEIIDKIVAKYYPDMANGTAVTFDYDTVKAQASTEVYADLKAQLEEKYALTISDEYFKKAEQAIIKGPQAKGYRKDAEDTVMTDVLASVESLLRNELTIKFKAELGSSATDEEVATKVNEVLTQEYILENKNKELTQKQIDELIEAAFLNIVATAAEEVIATDAYQNTIQNAINKFVASAEFKKELDNSFAKQGTDLIKTKLDSNIAGIISENVAKMYEEINKEIETAVTKFVEENYIKLYSGESKDDKVKKDTLYNKIGYYKEAGAKEGEGEGDESAAETSKPANAEKTYEPAYETYFDFVFKEKLQKPYNQVYPLPEKP